jgi:hypothetical protein
MVSVSKVLPTAAAPDQGSTSHSFNTIGCFCIKASTLSFSRQREPVVGATTTYPTSTLQPVKLQIDNWDQLKDFLIMSIADQGHRNCTRLAGSDLPNQVQHLELVKPDKTARRRF